MKYEVIATIAMLALGAAPIALNGAGGVPDTFTGGAIASPVLTSATGCNAYAFTAESTLGFGRRAADRLCIGTSTGDANTDFWSDGAYDYMKFNTAPNVALPHIALDSDVDSGIIISDATTPFTWVDEGAAKLTLGTRSSRTYLCAGAWNSSTIPCFTSDGTDFSMRTSDGGAFSGIFEMNAGKFFAKDGTAAAPAYTWNSDNTGFYATASGNWGVSINGTFAGNLAEYDAVAMGLEPATGYYIKIDTVSDLTAGAVTGDCNATTESGRIIYDYTNHKLALCNDISTTRAGWDTTTALLP